MNESRTGLFLGFLLASGGVVSGALLLSHGVVFFGVDHDVMCVESGSEVGGER